MRETFSFTYSVPYILLFIFYYVLFLWEKRSSSDERITRKIRFYCVSLFIVFFGLREYIYTDYLVYYPLYKATPFIWDFEGIRSFFSLRNDFLITRIEPGFKIYLIILKSISSNYFFLQFFSTILDAVFLNYFFKRYSLNYSLSFILFILFGGLIMEINLLRNIKAIFIFLYSIKYIQSRKIVPYIVCCLISFSFHSSAIFFFPMYFFARKKLSVALIWSVFIVGNIIYLLQLKFVSGIAGQISTILGGNFQMMFENYSEDDFSGKSYGISVGFIERTISYILLMSNYNRIRNFANSKIVINIFYNTFFIYYICFTLLSELSIFTDRVTPLFVYSYWILYTYYFNLSRVRIRRLFCFIIFLFGITKMYIGNNHILAAYRNILIETRKFQTAEATYMMYFGKIINKK